MTSETDIQFLTSIPPTVVVLVGFSMVIGYIFYQSAPRIFDIYIDISNGDYELFDSNVEIFDRFTWHELVLVVLSIYYQFTVVDPKTGVQSVLKNVTYIILFTVFIGFIVKSYLIEPTDN